MSSSCILYKSDLINSLKLIKVFFLKTNGYFAIGQNHSGRGPNQSILITLYNGREDITECQLVICNSGNLILKGYNGQTWEVLWKINEREIGNDCYWG